MYVGGPAATWEAGTKVAGKVNSVDSLVARGQASRQRQRRRNLYGHGHATAKSEASRRDLTKFPSLYSAAPLTRGAIGQDIN